MSATIGTKQPRWRSSATITPKFAASFTVGAVMRTGRTGTLGVTLKDNTVMSFGPDTEVVVDDYLFDPGQGGLKLAASITRGTMNFVSGLIAKLRPDAQSVRTPTGTIGVRGTQFLVKVDDPAQTTE